MSFVPSNGVNLPHYRSAAGLVPASPYSIICKALWDCFPVYTLSSMWMPGSDICFEELISCVLGERLQQGRVVKIAANPYYQWYLTNASPPHSASHVYRTQVQQPSSSTRPIICPGWKWYNCSLQFRPFTIYIRSSTLLRGSVARFARSVSLSSSIFELDLWQVSLYPCMFVALPLVKSPSLDCARPTNIRMCYRS